MGLIVQPFWGPGLDHPDGKGAMIGFGDVHTRAHIYRAVIEGLGYALRDGLQRIEKKGRIAFEKLAVSGGASQSDEICQISADIFNLPLVRGKTTETSGLGAAIVTAAGAGIHPSIDEAIEKMVTTAPSSAPIPTMWRSMQNSMGGSTGGCITHCGPSIERYRILPATLKNKRPSFKTDGFECLSDFLIASAKRPPH